VIAVDVVLRNAADLGVAVCVTSALVLVVWFCLWSLYVRPKREGDRAVQRMRREWSEWDWPTR
jgi:hypothetical protein